MALEPVLQNVEQRLVGFDRRTLGYQSFQFADLGDAGEPFVFEFATGEGQLFVKAMVVSAGDHQARPDRHRRDCQFTVGYGSDRNTVKSLDVVELPDLLAKQAQTHLHQPVVEMGQDDIVSTFGDIVIEGDRAANAGMGMFQSDGGSAPGAGQDGHFENASLFAVGRAGGLERWFFRQIQRDLDRTRNVLGRQMEIVLRFHESLVQAGDALLKTLFRRDELPRLGGLGFRRGGIQAATPAEHGFFDLSGDDRPDAAEILPDGVDLEDGTHQILVIARDIARFDGA